MCGILCLYNSTNNLKEKQNKFNECLDLLKYRGPDEGNSIVFEKVILGHRRLSIIDLEGGKQPFEYQYNGINYCITYNGEIYNMNELKSKLIDLGYHFKTQSDTEVIVVSYIEYKEKCVDYLEGIFSFVIYHENKIFACRDHLGVKPLFYHLKDQELIISSEIKCILKYINKAVVTKEGIKELLALGPSISPGKTLYKDIFSLEPAHYLLYDGHNLENVQYWKLEKKEHPHNYEETVRHVRTLVNQSIQKQLLSDVPISCMLSGGLDSSIITAVASQYHNNITTYSVDYEDQDLYFKAYDYQTTRDSHYINEVVELYHTNHKDIELTQENLATYLEQSLIARDMPGMADIDTSFLLFSNEIKKEHKVVLSGECADELFGGYPWFYKPELTSLNHFPWIREIDKRIDLCSDFVKDLNLDDYMLQQYNQTLSSIDYQSDIPEDTIKRKMIYLNYQWFMQTLLTRADSQSMKASIELRVPFASKDIIEYMYNVPWSFMYKDNREKGLLRDAFKDFLPEDIYDRKKNPYPKTHSPVYSKIIKELLLKSLEDSNNLLYVLFDINKIKDLIDSNTETDTPWFGQLMSGPQLLAYFYQIYLWGKIYKIELSLI